jgi:hypothetical protein
MVSRTQFAGDAIAACSGQVPTPAANARPARMLRAMGELAGGTPALKEPLVWQAARACVATHGRAGGGGRAPPGQRPVQPPQVPLIRRTPPHLALQAMLRQRRNRTVKDAALPAQAGRPTAWVLPRPASIRAPSTAQPACGSQAARRPMTWSKPAERQAHLGSSPARSRGPPPLHRFVRVSVGSLGRDDEAPANDRAARRRRDGDGRKPRWFGGRAGRASTRNIGGNRRRSYC